MSTWQLFAAVLAVGVAIGAVARMAISRHRTSTIMVLQFVAIPEIAFVWYALFGGPSPAIMALAPFAIAFYAGAIAAVVWSMIGRRKLMQPAISLDLIDRQHLAAFLVRAATIAFMSGIAFLFEPMLGVLNVVANAAWFALWIPRRWRRTEISYAYQVAADPGTVFEFVADTENWPRYRDDFVSAIPPGRLRAGSEVVTRLPLEWRSGRTAGLAKFVEVRSVVREMVRDRSILLDVVGRPEQTSQTELAPALGGTRVRVVSRGALTFPQAALGFWFEMPSQLAQRRAVMAQTSARLKKLVEAK